MNLTELEINIEGWSGPFDLLCSLVENKKFQVSEIKISQLIKIYGLYLLKTRQVPADTLAEFFYMTAGLLLEKTRSLLPGAKTQEEESEESVQNQENFMKSLERYKPYRRAYQFLTQKFEEQSKSFRREVPEPVININKEVIIYGDGGYSLAKNWKILSENYAARMKELNDIKLSRDNADWDGFAHDDQKQIEYRIAELEARLENEASLSFNEICDSRRGLVVTLLALLELCRMGKIKIEQKELFSDVRIIKS